MRIFRFFTLILSFFSLIAMAQTNKPVLRLGYENKPRLNAPPSPPLPDIKYYYGDTGMALQALNFVSAEALQEAVIPNVTGKLSESDKIFIRFRQYLHKNFAAGLSRAQLILIVRDQLPAIVRSYSAQPGYTNKDRVEFIEKAIGGGDRSEFSNYNIFFEFDSEGHFQTHDIEPNRLAVNTGSAVYFNLRDIMQKESFTLADAVQLWLHEIFHGDKSTPLKYRDAWAANVAQWVRQQTTEFQIKPGVKIVALSTPDGDQGKMEFLSNFPDRDFDESLQDRFLMVEESAQGTKVLRDVYNGFATFGNSLEPKTDIRGRVIQMPSVSVDKIRKTPENTLLIEYSQRTISYTKNYQGVYAKESPGGIGYSSLLRPPGDRYRIEWNIAKASVETTRTYSGNLGDGDFEIIRVKDAGKKRFISLRVKTKDPKSLLEAPSLHLIAKDSSGSQILSYELKHMRALGPDEVLIQVLVPQKSMEISRILLPLIGDYNDYAEISLRPSKPMVLQGRADTSAPPRKFQSLEVQEKATDQDKVKMILSLSDSKDVKGVTLDLEHVMLTQNYKSGFSGVDRLEDFNFTGLGRKYYIPKTELKLSPTSVGLDVPEVNLTKYQLGPVITQKISRFFTTSRQDKLPYLIDNQMRRITAIWVHYKDGQVEKVPLDHLPVKEFTLNSDQTMNRILEQAIKGAERRTDAILDAVVRPTCEGLF